jgi:hypothetical protein
MVQEAEALEKPGRPTFFETPAWSFSILVLAFVEKGMCMCVPAACPTGVMGVLAAHSRQGAQRLACPDLANR